MKYALVFAAAAVMNCKRTILALILAVAGAFAAATTVLDFLPLSGDGKPAPLADYRGKVLLIVNVASRSIFTPQYAGLETLYQKYQSQGLVVLAFPTNDFGQEEPANDNEIRQFATATYKITFPLFAKISTAGVRAAPLYQFLTDKQANATTGGPIRWNFTKFLIGRDGKVEQRFEPDIEPLSPELVVAVEKALQGEPAAHETKAARSTRPRFQFSLAAD